MIPTEILNLGAVAILFCLFIREFFVFIKWLLSRTKSKGEKGKEGEGYEKIVEGYKETLKEINKKLGNHLTDVNRDIGIIREDVRFTKKEMEGVQRDLAIVKDNVNDIKIRMK